MMASHSHAIPTSPCLRRQGITSALPVAVTFARASQTQASPQPTSSVGGGGRRQCLFALTTATTAALKAVQPLASAAESIPLFGIRKKIEKAEKEAEQAVKEGFKAAEKEIETVEKEIEAAAAVAEAEVGFSAAAQAGVVAGAEVVGILVATSVVNGILGPPKS